MRVSHMNLDKLGSKIKNNRRLLKLTQEQLAELIDVCPHYIYEIEKGLKTPSLPMLIAISENLHVSIDNLLSATSQGCNQYRKFAIGYKIFKKNLDKVIMECYNSGTEGV